MQFLIYIIRSIWHCVQFNQAFHVMVTFIFKSFLYVHCRQMTTVNYIYLVKYMPYFTKVNKETFNNPDVDEVSYL